MPIQDSTPQPRGTSSSEVNFKLLWITMTIVYIHPLNSYRELNSYMKRDIYIYIYIYHDPHEVLLLAQISLILSLSPSVPIIHHPWQVFQIASCVHTELLYVGSCWSIKPGTSMGGSISELRVASPVVSHLSCLSYLDSFRDGIQPYSCYFVGCCFQDLFNIACSIFVQFLSSCFSIHFVSIHVVHQYSSINTTAVLF